MATLEHRHDGFADSTRTIASVRSSSIAHDGAPRDRAERNRRDVAAADESSALRYCVANDLI